uniref:CUB domain-containing protein n=1 Tax=Macrostomum lignano TaxID=282301 RepID=A0A1I8J2P0_9PLAT
MHNDMSQRCDPVLVLLLLTCLKFQCEAANHYCNNNMIRPVKIDELQNQEETIVPVIFGESGDSELSYKSCRWSIDSSVTRKEIPLVLQGVTMDATVDRSSPPPKGEQKRPADFVVNYNGGKVPVTAGMFFALPIGQLLPLTVEASWDPRYQRAAQRHARFKGNCYAVSKVKANVTAAMSSIRGDAQLASFSSMTEIHNFTIANGKHEL